MEGSGEAERERPLKNSILCLKRISERPHKHDYCISRCDQEDGRLRIVKDGWRKVDEFEEVAQKLEPWCLE